MARPNIVVFGYDELLTDSLDFLRQAGNRISAVVFPSNRTDWRANKIREIVREKGFLTLEQPPKKESAEFVKKLRRIKPDVIYVWSYPMILPPAILEIPKYGCVNVHMGLLPEYRGINGVRWALLNGEPKTGVTIHFMDAGIDTGDIISQVSFPIEADDDILSLMIKSRQAGFRLLETCWRQIASGKARGVPQDESRACTYRSDTASPASIDWSKSNIEIHNLIRASAKPFPGVFTFWNKRQLVIRKSLPVDHREKTEAFGYIAGIDQNGIEITTGSGNLRVTRIESEDRILSPSEFENFGLKIGDRFENA